MKQIYFLLLILIATITGCKKSDDCHCVSDTIPVDVNVTSNGLFDINIQQTFNSTQKTVTIINRQRVSKNFTTNFKASEFDRVNITVSNADSITFVVNVNNNIAEYEMDLRGTNYNFLIP